MRATSRVAAVGLSVAALTIAQPRKPCSAYQPRSASKTARTRSTGSSGASAVAFSHATTRSLRWRSTSSSRPSLLPKWRYSVSLEMPARSVSSLMPACVPSR